MLIWTQNWFFVQGGEMGFIGGPCVELLISDDEGIEIVTLTLLRVIEAASEGLPTIAPTSGNRQKSEWSCQGRPRKEE